MSLLGRVRSFFSRAPAQKEPPTSGGSALPDLSIWQQFQRIGGGLTPADVSCIIVDADTGYTKRLIDLANEMRQKDGHLQSILQTREIAVARIDWETVVPGVDPKKSKRGQRQRRFIESAIQNHPQFRALVAHLESAVYYGYAVAEIVWKLDAKQRLVPGEFKFHSPRRFEFDRTTGKLVWRDDNMATGVDLRERFPGRFIIHQPRVNGDVPCREGLDRVLMWPALFRNWTLSDWLKLAEMAWKPWRIGSYTEKASKEDKLNLRDIVQTLTSSGAATHSDRVKLELLFPEGSSASSKETHAVLFEVMGREMSKAVLGQTLTVEQGQIGSQALGKVHNEIRIDLRDNDALAIMVTLAVDLVAPAIRLNFGDTSPVPMLRPVLAEAVDLKVFAEALDLLTGPNVQLAIPASWARDQAGIPEPEEDEELLGGMEWVEVDTSDLDPANDKPADAKPEDAAAA